MAVMTIIGFVLWLPGCYVHATPPAPEEDVLHILGRIERHLRAQDQTLRELQSICTAPKAKP